MSKSESTIRHWTRLLAQVDPVRPIPRWVKARATVLAVAASAAVLGGLLAQELVVVGTDIRRWDALLLSGYITVVAALWLARGQRQRFISMVEQIHAGRALRLNSEEGAREEEAEQDLMRRSEIDANLWSNLGGLGIGSLIAVAWPTVTAGAQSLAAVAGGTLLAVAAGYVVGRQVGAFMYRGYWGLTLSRRATIVPLPGHPDGAAGLRPIGAYYFSQALLLAIPAAFLLIWTLLIPFWDFGRYEAWRSWYQGLLALALAAEAVAFVAPLLGVHRRMAERKAELLARRAGELTRSIERVRRELEGDLEATRRMNLRDQLEELTSAYHDIEQMPTWPVDRAIRTRFTAHYLIMFVPLLAQWLDGNGSWQALADRLVQGS